MPLAAGSSISRIDDNLTARTSEKHLQRVQNVSPQDTLIPYKIRVQLALILIPIQMNPNYEAECRHRTTSDTTHQTRHSLSRVEL